MTTLLGRDSGNCRTGRKTAGQKSAKAAGTVQPRAILVFLQMIVIPVEIPRDLCTRIYQRETVLN
jgi:hypothetical protein